ncbi:MAG: beta-lactamase family protein [Muribaculaceae bacterium]|nr:beta-lactamase family protein [Muribaculaceae bacterium]
MRNNKLKISSSYVLTALSLAIIVAAVFFVSCYRNVEKRYDYIGEGRGAASLDSLFRTVFPDDGPGGIIEVRSADSVVFRAAYGLANLETKEAITDSTVFNLAFSSKFFSATAVMKLVEDGVLSLDDSLAKFFPEFQGDFFKKITIRNVLSHTSGLPDIRPVNPDEWDSYMPGSATVFSNVNDYILYGMEDEHMKVFARLISLAWEPGSHYDRTDPSYMLLAPIIERATGVKFENWMCENLFIPSGMNEAFYYTPGEPLPPMAHAYRHPEGVVPKNTFVSKDGLWEEHDYGETKFFLTKANRGLFTTLRSFNAFLQAYYKGELISKESMALMATPLNETGVPYSFYGFGTAIRCEPGTPSKNYHLSNNGAFSVIDGCWPEENIYYSILSNRNDWDMREVMTEVDDIIRKNYFK